jgi:hypothetical protein
MEPSRGEWFTMESQQENNDDANYRRVGRHVSRAAPLIIWTLRAVYEKNRKVLYVQVMRAIYGMLEAPYYGTRSTKENWNKKDSNSIHMIHLSQTVSRKDRSMRFFFMWYSRSSGKDPKVAE